MQRRTRQAQMSSTCGVASGPNPTLVPIASNDRFQPNAAHNSSFSANSHAFVPQQGLSELVVESFSP